MRGRVKVAVSLGLFTLRMHSESRPLTPRTESMSGYHPSYKNNYAGVILQESSVLAFTLLGLNNRLSSILQGSRIVLAHI
jgi:hypothetical protein